MPGLAAPVLIERAILLGADGKTADIGQVQSAAAFQRRGHRVVLITPRPGGWRPTRRHVDRDLILQQQLHQLFLRAGAELDGVLYVSASPFRRRLRQQEEFASIAARYGRSVGELTLVCRDSLLIEAARRAGLKLQIVADSGAPSGFDDLETALKSVK